MQWEALESKIQNWIHFMRIAVSIYIEFIVITFKKKKNLLRVDGYISV